LTDLAQTEMLSIISRERIIDCFPSDQRTNHTFEQCVKAAKSLGAVHLLSGSFYKLGDKIRIDARLQDVATGNVVQGFKVIGKDPFTLVDSLTQKIASSLNISSSLSENVQVANFTSSSTEAFRYYQSGLEKMQAELYDEAIADFEHALSIDSTFALPYMRIGMCHVFDGRQQQGTPYFEKAREFEAKLPVRDRHLLEGYAQIWLDREFGKASNTFESFVQRYPDDKEGRSIYAALISNLMKDTTTALAHLDTVLEQDPTYQFALSQRAAIYERHLRLDEAID